MGVRRRSVWLYLLNFALLFTHEIDSAYWKEWALFGMPGGIQLFLLINFALLLVFGYGLVRLVDGARAGYGFALALAAGGVLAFLIHGAFFLAGHPEFTLPASVLVLVAGLACSLAQGVDALSVLRDGQQPT